MKTKHYGFVRKKIVFLLFEEGEKESTNSKWTDQKPSKSTKNMPQKAACIWKGEVQEHLLNHKVAQSLLRAKAIPNDHKHQLQRE